MEPIRITSVSNPIIKEVRSLYDKKGRQSTQALLLEGLRLVNEVAESGLTIRYFVVSDSFFERTESIFVRFPNIKIIQLPDELFARIGQTQTPQGLMAVMDLPDFNEREIVPKLRRIIVLENLQDPGNLGTIIRTADACSFDAVLLSRDSVDPYNPKVIRSTMGSLFHLPVIIVDDIYETLKTLQTKSIRIVAAHPRNAVPCWQADLSDSVALVIGNEGSGITKKMLNLADLAVMIPMVGRAESLNASAAASILLYESMRQLYGAKV